MPTGTSGTATGRDGGGDEERVSTEAGGVTSVGSDGLPGGC